MNNKFTTKSAQIYRAKFNFLSKYFKINNNIIIAGGCFKNIFLNQTPKDIDFFFYSKSDFDSVYNHMLNDKEYKFVYDTLNCIAFKDLKTGVIIELIKHITRDPQYLLSRFDFTITQFALYKNNGNFLITYSSKYFEHLLNKTLSLNLDSTNTPISWVNRILRYIKYGYNLNYTSKLEFIKITQKINIETDLREELINYPKEEYQFL